MLNIAYAPNDVQLAERLQHDLSSAGVQLENHMLIVLVTPDSVADQSILQAVQRADEEGQVIVLFLVRQALLPDSWKRYRRFALRDNYRVPPMRVFLNRADVSPGKRRRNNRWLAAAAIIIVVMVGISMWAIAGDIVAFPVEEYMTENAERAEMIQDLVAPTLEAWQPRTTEDAINFPMTVEAANTRNAPLLIMTATALPRDRQATLEAQATAADLTATARAVDPASSTPGRSTPIS